MKYVFIQGERELPAYKCKICGYSPNIRGMVYFKEKNKYFCSRCGSEIKLNHSSGDMALAKKLKDEFEKRSKVNG